MLKETNKNLKELNTFGIEAFCDEYFKITETSQLSEINFDKDALILGGGSNMVIKSKIPQVINIATKGIQIISDNNNDVFIKVQAGEIWDEFVSFCVENEYYGAENLSLIPGTVGAAPIQNIGAYGAEAKDIIDSVEYFEIATKSIKTLKNEECNFAYRNSIFKNELKGKIIVVSVDFKLKKNGKLNIEHGGVQKYFCKINANLLNVREVIIMTRKQKLPDYKILGNSGSFFKNAVVNQQKINELKTKYNDFPHFKVNNGFKIPTAWLIETAGMKGFKHKNAAVCEKHALILVNQGSATAQHILELAEIIENTVFEKFGIKIEKEVNVI